MKRLVFVLVLFGASLAGCVGEDSNDEALDQGPNGTGPGEEGPVESSHLVDYSQGAVQSTDLMGWDCELSDEVKRQYFLRLEPGSRVDANHTELEFTLTLENVFSDADYTRYRIGAYYDHQLVFWSDAFRETTTFTHELDGATPDLDKDQRWTFAFKRTDPLTEDDPDACTAGHGIQEDLDIQIYAR